MPSSPHWDPSTTKTPLSRSSFDFFAWGSAMTVAYVHTSDDASGTVRDVVLFLSMTRAFKKIDRYRENRAYTQTNVQSCKKCTYLIPLESSSRASIKKRVLYLKKEGIKSVQSVRVRTFLRCVRIGINQATPRGGSNAVSGPKILEARPCFNSPNTTGTAWIENGSPTPSPRPRRTGAPERP